MKKYSLLFTLLMAVSALTQAKTLTTDKVSFQSGEQQVALVELYTSQGCSSCPPAERFFNQFETDKRLWSEFIPLAFHVDYWNYLGWDDEYSSKAHSDRQRLYGELNNHGVYTPGFLVSGDEWRGFFSRSGRYLDFSNRDIVGNLSVELENNQIQANFSPSSDAVQSSGYILNVAVIAMDVASKIESGENRGRTLIQDFVVVHHENWKSKTAQWNETLNITKDLPETLGLVAWISNSSHLKPIQSTGGLL